jgi:hypothetical protein
MKEEKIQIVPATFKSHKTNMSGHDITFTVDNSLSETLSKVALMPKGKNVVILVMDVEEGDNEFKQLVTNGQRVRSSLMARIHAISGEYSRTTGVDKSEILKVVKAKMIARGIKHNSFKDYQEEELATAIHVLSEQLDPSQFNWGLYIK